MTEDARELIAENLLDIANDSLFSYEQKKQHVMAALSSASRWKDMRTPFGMNTEGDQNE